MAEPGGYSYRVLRFPRGTDLDGAIAELRVHDDGFVTMDIRIPARQELTMAEHKIGNMVVLTGTIVAIDGDVAMVRVDKAVADNGTIAVRLGRLPAEPWSDEARIRDAMAEAHDHPGRTVTR